MDPIGQMVNELKIGSRAKKPIVSFRFSALKFSALECLKKNGFVSSVEKRIKHGLPFIDVGLVYDEDKGPKITEAFRISKPSRRMYFGYRDIRKVRGGIGLIVLSTPKGVLSGDDARKELVGGEPLFEVW